MKTAIVILNWNGRKMLETFLPSVLQGCCATDEVIVADNGSTDNSLPWLAATHPTVRVIALDRNYGFAEGYNRALSQVDADYYVLLNDDVEVTPGWTVPVTALMEAQRDVAVAQPKLLMYHQRDTFEYAGAAGGYIDALGYPFCRGRIFQTLEQDHGQYNQTCDIFWASGAAMFVRASVWKELQGLDGDFFAHMEEIDFCWRVQNMGYRICYCPESTVYHVGGGTLPKSSPHKTYLNFRNNLSMLYKNLPATELSRKIHLRYLLDGVAALRFLLQGHPKELAAVYRAHRDFRSQKPALQAKREQLHPHKVKHIYQGNLLVDYYLRKKTKYTDLDTLNL